MITGSGTGFFKEKTQPDPAPSDAKIKHRKNLAMTTKIDALKKALQQVPVPV
jgi:hypothetical protein